MFPVTDQLTRHTADEKSSSFRAHSPAAAASRVQMITFLSCEQLAIIASTIGKGTGPGAGADARAAEWVSEGEALVQRVEKATLKLKRSWNW